MPVIKSAKKKLRQDKKRQISNKIVREKFKTALKDARKLPTVESVTKAVSMADIAAKKFIIHKNKANRIKSSLAKLLAKGKEPVAPEAPIVVVKKIKKATTPKIKK